MAANTRDATAYGAFAGQKPLYEHGNGNIGIVGPFRVDMAAVKAYLGVAIDGNNGDIVQIWDIPALTHIYSVAVKLWTPEGAAATVAIGDGTQAAGFLAAFSINGTAGDTKMTLISDAYGLTNGCSYNATDTLDLTFATDTDIAVAIFDVLVYCVQFVFPNKTVLSPTAWH